MRLKPRAGSAIPILLFRLPDDCPRSAPTSIHAAMAPRASQVAGMLLESDPRTPKVTDAVLREQRIDTYKPAAHHSVRRHTKAPPHTVAAIPIAKTCTTVVLPSFDDRSPSST